MIWTDKGYKNIGHLIDAGYVKFWYVKFFQALQKTIDVFI